MLSVFNDGKLKLQLDKVGINRLLIVGAYTNASILVSARDALEQKYQVIVGHEGVTAATSCGKKELESFSEKDYSHLFSQKTTTVTVLRLDSSKSPNNLTSASPHSEKLIYLATGFLPFPLLPFPLLPASLLHGASYDALVTQG